MSEQFKICFVLGTRPEIIKLYSSIQYCHQNNISYFVIHTNQHYNSNMDTVFFDELELAKPKYNLQVGSGSHASMTAKMLTSMEEVIEKEKPDIVIVHGDTNSTLAGALVAAKMGIKVAHIEAGLRSYDRSMPEELNRIMVDHISDFVFAPTESQKKTLQGEGINEHKIFVVGNTIVDAIMAGQKMSQVKSTILESLGLKGHNNHSSQNDLNLAKIKSKKLVEKSNDLFSFEVEEVEAKEVEDTNQTTIDDLFGPVQQPTQESTIQNNQFESEIQKYFLLTCHRPSNTDKIENFRIILQAIDQICNEQKAVCIFPAHPRLNAYSEVINEFKNLKVIEPVGFLDMIALETGAEMIFTDSGGIQEEACILNKKTIILRTNTERPETLEIGGANLIKEISVNEIKTQFKQLTQKSVTWHNPFGDGLSGSKIIHILTNSIDKN
jgi:UDP-N-acetylglucosamine 2-epimerase (non-hydrolysing)